MLTTRVFEFPSGQFLFAKQEPFRIGACDDLPAVPALPETLLAMELQLHNQAIDLRAVSEAVRADLGATIQILRLAGRERGDYGDASIRIEDCIAELGLEACLTAASSGTFAKGALDRPVLEMWAHAREIAQACWLLADEAQGIIHPYEAYLAGLLHSMGSLPRFLRWSKNGLGSDEQLNAMRMAERWRFPAALADFFTEVKIPGKNPQLSKIVADAHQLIGDNSAPCPMLDSSALPRVSWTIK